MPRYAAKVDNNHRQIVDALRQAFGPDAVFDTSGAGRGFPDICVGVRGVNIFIEIKGKRGKLTPDQELFHMNWDGQVAVVRTIDEALAVVAKETT
jgi:Holliday junction resolvase